MIAVPKGGIFVNGADIFGVIIMALCGFGCGALFFGMGVWAARSGKPVHFWSGSKVDPKAITNVAAYNRENARMWKQFSVSFWMCGILAIASLWAQWCAAAYTILIFVGSIGGGIWLVLRYQRIFRKYDAGKRSN